ncbi:SURF1 family cytochrome oxidase biogenesis protein [Leucobacter chromiireducens]|uniref:SURF1 family cytochrome oxidase biogenesis protein n=1 Tax=Leucobacter chromiireducens TaxID=283877 RepID=UPI001F155099|nr:SURF1 family protein [Leucobacter chromiireducens]
MTTEDQMPQQPTDHSPAAPAVGWSFLRSGRWFGYFTMLVIFSIACVLLGNWQFERRAEARAEIERLDSNYGSPAAPLADELPERAAFDSDHQKWRTVWVSGEYEGDPFLARNRPGPGGVGSDLIQALRTDDGEIFFVDRGWVSVDGGSAERGDVQIADLPAPPVGPVRVEARLRASEPEIAGRTSVGITVASIELPELARLTGTEGEAYTGAYGMLVSESPAGEHGVLPPEPERDEGPHLSYALQWYVFIIIACVGVAIAARREYRSLNADSGVVQEQDRRAAARKERRGPSDADVEDALLG